MPEWYLVLFALTALSGLGIALWSPLLVAIPFLAIAFAALAFEAGLGAARASFPRASGSRWTEWRLRTLTAFLYMLQPLSRLAGRLRYGLTPWRRRPGPTVGLPRPRTISTWSEQWRSQDERLAALEQELRGQGGTLNHGTEYDRWDLEVRGGVLGAARMRMAVEEHGGGRQLVRIRSWPHCSRPGVALIGTSTVLAAAAALDGAWIACGLLAMSALVLIATALWDCATATGIMIRALEKQLEDTDIVKIDGGERLAPWVRARRAHAARGRDNGGRRRDHTETPGDGAPASARVADDEVHREATR
jgi:O-antigen biosynthesis protein